MFFGYSGSARHTPLLRIYIVLVCSLFPEEELLSLPSYLENLWLLEVVQMLLQQNKLESKRNRCTRIPGVTNLLLLYCRFFALCEQLEHEFQV